MGLDVAEVAAITAGWQQTMDEAAKALVARQGFNWRLFSPCVVTRSRWLSRRGRITPSPGL
jgi:hypothetical protein